MQDISTPDVSTPEFSTISFNPGLFNPNVQPLTRGGGRSKIFKLENIGIHMLMEGLLKEQILLIFLSKSVTLEYPVPPPLFMNFSTVNPGVYVYSSGQPIIVR